MEVRTRRRLPGQASHCARVARRPRSPRPCPPTRAVATRRATTTWLRSSPATSRPPSNAGARRKPPPHAPLRASLPTTNASVESSRTSGLRTSASSSRANGLRGCFRCSATAASPRTICAKAAPSADPLRRRRHRGQYGSPRLLVLGAGDPQGKGEDPLTLKPCRLQFHGEVPPADSPLAETWRATVTRRIFA